MCNSIIGILKCPLFQLQVSNNSFKRTRMLRAAYLKR